MNEDMKRIINEVRDEMRKQTMLFLFVALRLMMHVHVNKSKKKKRVRESECVRVDSWSPVCGVCFCW